MNEEQSAWLGILGGGALAALGLRRGGAIGATLVVGGVGMLLDGVRRYGAPDGYFRPTRTMPPPLEPADFPEPKDRVQEASEESFPASDPPAHSSSFT